MLDRKVRPNEIVEQDGSRRLDIAGITAFVEEALASHAGQPVEYVAPVGHGAAIAAIQDDRLAFAPLDYEQEIPADLVSDYRARRDAFAVTGSPALPAGLNIGTQLYWLERLHADAVGQSVLLPWAQYWTWFLCGSMVSEVSSLGCHTDLWSPAAGDFSDMAKRAGWAERFAPLAKAGDVVGTLRPDLARRTGLSSQVKVLAGLHDSNAALLAARGFPAIGGHEATVLSTGTWFIAMRTPSQPVDTGSLPEGRDCLVNVDVDGKAVPSARFMGGREIETVIGLDTRRVDIKPDQPALLAAVPDLLDGSIMLLPTLAPGCGPFPDGQARWIGEPRDWYARRAAMCLYAALVADASLGLIGSRDRLLVEGRFAEAEVFVRALAALRPDTQIFTANAHNDVSFGALRLIDPLLVPQGELAPVEPLEGDLATYRDAWQAAIGGHA